jgi:hypothetical protein
MARIEKTVSVSYRRTDEPWALAVFGDLTQHGYEVFIDYDGIASGDFETAILENIRARAHFLVLLTPTALERRSDPVDWMRREIEAALDSKRNIVPLMLEGFDFDTPAVAGQLDGKLEGLKKYNGLSIPKGYFPPAMERLRTRFLNVPVDAVLYSASFTAQRAATEQKGKAARALADNAADNLPPRDVNRAALTEILRISFGLVSSKQSIALIAAALAYIALDSVYLKQLPTWALLLLVLTLAAGYLGVGYPQWHDFRTRTESRSRQSGTAFFRLLRPFAEDSAQTFFGREDEIGETMSLISSEDFRAGVLVGESGSGKTSLIRAGVKPALEQRGIPVEYVNLLNISPASVLDAVRKLSATEPPSTVRKTPMVFFDQCENWLTPKFRQRQSFQELREVINLGITSNHIRVLFIVRKESFIDLLTAFEDAIPEIGRHQNRINLPLMARDKVRQIIQTVSYQSTIRVDEELIDEMLNDLDVGEILPAELEIVFSVLHEGHDHLTLQMYKEMGGKEGILKRYLEDRILQRYPTHLQSDVKLVLLALIQNNERRALTAKELVSDTGLGEEAVLDIVGQLQKDDITRPARGPLSPRPLISYPFNSPMVT